MFGQAFVHFIGRDWKSASAAVGLCESLVTDIVAALDSATVITVRSFILLAEISQYKVDMNVLHSTIDMILGTPTSSSTSTHAHQRDSSNAAGITPLIPISLLNTDSNAARNSDSTIINNNNNNNMNDINDTKLQQKNDHNISTADGGAFVDAGRAFQYHHRALFVYYAIIMSSLTILESSKFDIRKEKEKEKKIKKSQKMKKEKNMKYNTLDANSFGSMSSMISKKLRRATSSFLSRTSYSSSSSSTDSSPTASSLQQQQKQQHNDASTTERSSTLSNTFDTSRTAPTHAKSIGKYKNDAVSKCSCNYR